METEEDIDLGGEGVADPFDGDPADEPATGVVDVSDGPEEARLGGVNTSDLDPADPADPGQEPPPGEDPMLQEPGDEPPIGEPPADPLDDPDPLPEEGGIPDDDAGSEPDPEPDPEPPAPEPDEQAQAKPPKKSKGGKPLRQYTMLVANQSGNYEDCGTIDAHNEEHAIRTFWPTRDQESGTVAAVPARYFRPRSIKVQPVTNTKVTIS